MLSNRRNRLTQQERTCRTSKSSPEQDPSAGPSPCSSPNRAGTCGSSPGRAAARTIPLIERRKVDVSDADALREAFDGAAAVYHCIHAAYNADAWERELPAAEQTVLEAAGHVGAVVVFPESLYSYDTSQQPMTEHTPRSADSAVSAASAPGC